MKEIPQDFRFDLDRLAHGGIISVPVKVSEEWKENFCMPQESFEKLCSKVRPYIQKNKGFRDPMSMEKQVAAALYYFANEGRM